MWPSRSLGTSGARSEVVAGTPGALGRVAVTGAGVPITSAVVYLRVEPGARHCVGVTCTPILVTGTVVHLRVDPWIKFIRSTSASVSTSAISIVYSALAVVIDIAANTRVQLIGDIGAVRAFIGRLATVCARGRIGSIVIPSYSTCSPVVTITVNTRIRLVRTIIGGRRRRVLVVFDGVFDFVDDIRHDGQW